MISLSPVRYRVALALISGANTPKQAAKIARCRYDTARCAMYYIADSCGVPRDAIPGHLRAIGAAGIVLFDYHQKRPPNNARTRTPAQAENIARSRKERGETDAALCGTMTPWQWIMATRAIIDARLAAGLPT